MLLLFISLVLIIGYDIVDPSVADTIPDFSRVGYHYGDKTIPEIPVKITLNAPKGDAYNLIQNAIDKIEAPGAILLKAGTYKLSQGLKIRKSGVVLRGEGEKTALYCTSREQIPCVVEISSSENRELGSSTEITADYVPVGQMWVPVKDPSMFKEGETVFLFRPATEGWLDDIHMREIAQNKQNSVKQWTPHSFGIYWERRIERIEGNRLWLDNPVVMGIGGDAWGRGSVYQGKWNRISESAVENLLIDTSYDPSEMKGDDYTDEDHAWSGVVIKAAENCWVRNVTTRHMGFSCVSLSAGAKFCTVSHCSSLSPVSKVTGSRRYAFYMGGCQMCIFQYCDCDDDRHQYVSGSKVPGPNVFLRCTSTNSRGEAGPHHRWSTGILYDNVKVDGALNVHDRAGYGSGHGWTSANVVLYNCEAKSIVCQQPWASAKNWAIGCIGKRTPAQRKYYDDLGPRPDGQWISEGAHVSPESLYESQLEERHSKGIILDR